MLCNVLQCMKKILFPVLLAGIFLTSCSGEKAPDVSHITVNLEVQRFEHDFFSIDTLNIVSSLEQLSQKYPAFLKDYMINILGLPVMEGDQQLTESLIRKFISDYRAIKDSSDKTFGNNPGFVKEVEQGLKYVKYYFPDYLLPEKLITFIGPLDAIYMGSTGSYGDVLTEEALAVGLQLHLGSNFSVYQSEFGLAMYPAYISRKFAPEYIAVNCIKNIIDDIFPDNSYSLPLIEQMVEKGKRMYLLDKLLPYTADTLKLGYTDAQLKGCYANEGLIWNFFVKNGLLFNNEELVIKSYIGDAPSTPEFGEGSPGYIGLFVGRQIVKEFMDRHPDLSLTDLMHTPPREVYEKSKYKPK